MTADDEIGRVVVPDVPTDTVELAASVLCD